METQPATEPRKKSDKATIVSHEIGTRTDPGHFTTLYIARHGETEWNVKDILQGQLDSPLTERGLKQAADLALEMKDETFAAIFSSDLLRASRTAEVVSVERKLAVKTSQLLRERNWGRFDGRQASYYREEARELLQKYQQLSDEERWQFKPYADIESFEEIHKRLMVFLRETAVAYKGRSVLVISHLDVLRTLLIHLGCPPRDVDNLSYVKLLSDGTHMVVEKTKGITFEKGKCAQTPKVQ